MKEKIYNLYLIVKSGIITEVGAVTHELSGTDSEKLEFLKNHVIEDFDKMKVFELPSNVTITINEETVCGIDYVTFRDFCYKGQQFLIFEEVFKYYKADDCPLTVITTVKDGEIVIEGEFEIRTPDNLIPDKIHIEMPKNWLLEYKIGDKLRLDKLIDDDFFNAIRILFNAKQYVSSMKLLVIAIDTISFLEHDDLPGKPGSFIMWCNKYLLLNQIDITSEELWEFRNSILHMTNLDSRKVRKKDVKRIMFYISNKETEYVKETDEGKAFNFLIFLDIVANGIRQWADSYNSEKDKFEDFVMRYDRIISDKRATVISME